MFEHLTAIHEFIFPQEKHKVPGPEEESDADTPGADQLPKDDAIKFRQGLNQSCFGGPLLTKMLIG